MNENFQRFFLLQVLKLLEVSSSLEHLDRLFCIMASPLFLSTSGYRIFSGIRLDGASDAWTFQCIPLSEPKLDFFLGN